jgi:hypothetical protein
VAVFPKYRTKEKAKTISYRKYSTVEAEREIDLQVHKLLTTLGPKLYFLRVPKTEQKSDDSYYQQLQHNDFDTKRDEIQQA